MNSLVVFMTILSFFSYTWSLKQMLLRMIDRNKSTRYWTNLVESLWNTSSLLGSLTTAFGMFSLLPLCSFPWLHHRKSALGFWIPCPMSQDYFDHKTKKKPICYLYTKNFLQSTGKTWLQNIGIISTVLIALFNWIACPRKPDCLLVLRGSASWRGCMCRTGFLPGLERALSKCPKGLIWSFSLTTYHIPWSTTS